MSLLLPLLLAADVTTGAPLPAPEGTGATDPAAAPALVQSSVPTPTPAPDQGLAPAREPAPDQGLAPARQPAPASASTPAHAPALVVPSPTPSNAITLRGGPGEGMRLESADGAFTLQLRALAQVRYTETVDEQEAGSDLRHGEQFVARRLRLSLRGQVLRKDLQYTLLFGFAPMDVEQDRPLPLLDAFATWQPSPRWGLRAGQMKVPFGAQRNMAASALLFPDGPSVTNEFTLDRDVGVTVLSDGVDGRGYLAYALGLFGGEGRNRTVAAAQLLPDQRSDRNVVPGLLPVARIALRPFGRYDDELVEGDRLRGGRPRLTLGLDAAYNANTSRPRGVLGTPYTFARFSHTLLGADLSFKWKGLSFLSELYHRRMNKESMPNPRVGEDGSPPTGEPAVEYSRPGWGAFGQLGSMIPGTQRWEAALRYGAIHPTTGVDRSQRELHELAGGLTWYVHGQELKFQLDVTRYVWLADSGNKDQPNRWQSHLQGQLYF